MLEESRSYWNQINVGKGVLVLRCYGCSNPDPPFHYYKSAIWAEHTLSVWDGKIVKQTVPFDDSDATTETILLLSRLKYLELILEPRDPEISEAIDNSATFPEQILEKVMKEASQIEKIVIHISRKSQLKHTLPVFVGHMSLHDCIICAAASSSANIRTLWCSTYNCDSADREYDEVGSWYGGHNYFGRTWLNRIASYGLVQSDDVRSTQSLIGAYFIQRLEDDRP